MQTPFEISDRFTEQWADAMPIDATNFGITGRDHLCTDYSPDGYGARADLYRATKDELAPHVDGDDSTQTFAAEVLTRWLDEQIGAYESGKWRRDLNHTESPFQKIRDIFDVMGRSNPDDWDAIAARLEGFGGMVGGYRRSLSVGIDEADTVARRQVEALVEQVDATPGRFSEFPTQARAAGGDADRVEVAVAALDAVCAEFGAWLRSDYLPVAVAEDGVGRDRYAEGVDEFVGMSIDLEETYEWGWDEVHAIRAAMAETSSEIDPSASIQEVIELLDTDPARSAATRDDFVRFVSAVQQKAITQLAGRHFDVPDELKVVTVNIAPPGGGLGAWYVSPSEDFTRAGSIWYAPGERESLPYWQEVSTAYHEGFPGHHLQVGTAVLQRERLSRFHRLAIWCSGSGEGWALYAERLMDELEFFEKPEYRLGLLASQLFRSVRVVVDIGCHLGLSIPDNAPIHGGDRWDYERAVDYMNLIGLQPRDVSESEVTRYLGWYGQAISYKVGEREILKMRERARSAPGFDLKEFHRRFLDAGAIRLDHMWEVMS